jgi:hypothetical protein
MEIMIEKARHGDFLLKYDSLISNTLRLYGKWALNKISLWAYAGASQFLSKSIQRGFLFAGQIRKVCCV